MGAASRKVEESRGSSNIGKSQSLTPLQDTLIL